LSQEGDCTEHAVLTAAMCRAAGIPSRIAVGIAYVDTFLGRKNIFVPHAWTQVFIQGKWYSIDAALGSSDARRITFKTGDGSPSDFFSQINTIGNLKINSISL
ncbi:MAG: transglutaminase domain-containing protein, partial [Chitinispirillia bacterium]